MTYKQFKAYFLFDVKVYFNEPMVIFFAVLFPALMYVVFGFIFGSTQYGASGDIPYYDQYSSSFMGIILLNTALFNIGPSLAVYKELGFFRRLMVTPLPINALILSTLLKAFIIFLIGMFEVVVIGWFMFERMPPANPVDLFFALTVTAFCLFSFGFLLGSIFKHSNSAFSASVLIFQPMLFLSGASIPLEVFPPFLILLTKLVPMTYVVEIVRLAWYGQMFTSAAITPTVACLVIGGICIVISNKIFKKSAI